MIYYWECRPAGSVIVSAGSVVPAGSVIVSAVIVITTGSVVPAGSVIVPAGSVVPAGRVIVPLMFLKCVRSLAALTGDDGSSLVKDGPAALTGFISESSSLSEKVSHKDRKHRKKMTKPDTNGKAVKDQAKAKPKTDNQSQSHSTNQQSNKAVMKILLVAISTHPDGPESQ
ncbi:hypothetical protein Tco_0500909 [Tanacetum coccineum]